MFAQPRGGQAAAAAGVPAAAAATMPGSNSTLNSLLARARAATAGIVLTQAGASNALKYLFYISLFIFILFLILLFIHYAVHPIFSFSPTDAGFIPIPTFSDAQTYFSKALVQSDEPIPVKGLSPCGYTLATDLYISKDYVSLDTPRILLYRATAPVTMVTGTPKAGEYVNYLVDKLPQSNFALWMDPINNDIYFSAMTSQEDLGVRVETTSPPLENVPVEKVFRLTIVFTEYFVELYLNGKLQKSFPFKFKPLQVQDSAALYALAKPAGAAPFNVSMSNVAFWPRQLTAREIDADGQPKVDAMFFTTNR